MLILTKGTYKRAGEFLEGELAYDQGKIYVCVMTDTHRPQAFRALFRRCGEEWKSAGGLSRFGHNREMYQVRIEGGGCLT